MKIKKVQIGTEKNHSHNYGDRSPKPVAVAAGVHQFTDAHRNRKQRPKAPDVMDRQQTDVVQKQSNAGNDQKDAAD